MNKLQQPLSFRGTLLFLSAQFNCYSCLIHSSADRNLGGFFSGKLSCIQRDAASNAPWWFCLYLLAVQASSSGPSPGSTAPPQQSADRRVTEKNIKYILLIIKNQTLDFSLFCTFWSTCAGVSFSSPLCTCDVLG